MLKITCPYCGERDETEFKFGGEAHIARPTDPSSLNDKQWADFLFMRSNKKGLHRERWIHAQGCRKWFNMLRDTTNHTIIGSYEVGEKPTIAELKKRSKQGAAK